MMGDCPHCVALRRQVCDLEAELEAWRAFDGEEFTEAAEALRLWRIKRAVWGTQRGPCRPATARALSVLMSANGRLVTRDRLHKAIVRSDPDSVGLKIVDVVISHLRKGLADRGLRGVIATVWGRGFVVDRDASERIKAALGAEVFA